jgi:hypothetical protein
LAAAALDFGAAAAHRHVTGAEFPDWGKEKGHMTLVLTNRTALLVAAISILSYTVCFAADSTDGADRTTSQNHESRCRNRHSRSQYDSSSLSHYERQLTGKPRPGVSRELRFPAELLAIKLLCL